MNVFIADGEVIATPKEIQNDKGVIARFSLIQSKEKEEGWKNNANFIPCVCFGRIAEVALKHLTPGRKVVIRGEYRSYSYMDNEGKEVYGSQIKVNEIKFCDYPQNSNEEEEFSEFVPVEPFEENGSDISEDT